MLLVLVLAGCGPTSITLDTGGERSSGDSGETGDDTGDTGGETGGDTGGDTGDGLEDACSRWLPLNVGGARWTYRDGGVEVIVDGNGAARWEGQDAFEVEIDDGGSSPLLQYYVCTDEGLAILAIASGVKYANASAYTITWDPPVLFTPSDLTPNMEWSTSSMLTITQGGSTQSQRITSTGRTGDATTTTVAAGTFDTIPVVLDVGFGSGSEMNQWLSHDVGLVRGNIGDLLSYELP